jgi:1,4-dihydroxy-2-naphthoate octaprenyltransferase
MDQSIPDAVSDKKTGKNHLVVALGKETARFGYAFVLLAAFLIVMVGVQSEVFPTGGSFFLTRIPFSRTLH